jgi:hypothetical protein
MYLGACAEAQCQCIADNPSTCLELRRVFGQPACGSVCSISRQINERHRAHLPLTAPDRQVANARSITPGVKSRQTPRIAVTRDQEIRVNVWWFRGAHDDLACDNPSDLSGRVSGTRPPCPCHRDEGLRIAKFSRPHGSPKSGSQLTGSMSESNTLCRFSSPISTVDVACVGAFTRLPQRLRHQSLRRFIVKHAR